MYGKEYQAWITLGGTVNFLAVIDDTCDMIKQTKLYKGFPPTMSETEKRVILERTALNLISQDYAKLMQAVHDTKLALDNDQIEKAQKILEHLFDE